MSRDTAQIFDDQSLFGEISSSRRGFEVLDTFNESVVSIRMPFIQNDAHHLLIGKIYFTQIPDGAQMFRLLSASHFGGNWRARAF